MSTDVSNLCVLLVENLYGELTSRIFRFLLRDGRLSTATLRYHTGLSLRQIQHGLSVLVQQQLVFWYTSAEESTVYEANTAVAYNLIRPGKYVQLAEEQLGNFAAAIVSNLLLLGHARVGDLVQAYGLHRTEGTNDPAAIATQLSIKSMYNGSINTEVSLDDNRISLALVHMTLRELLRVGFVSLVNESYFRSEADNRTEAGKIVPPPEYFRAKSKRDNEAQRETAIQVKLEEWKYGTKAEKEQYAPIMNGKKRQLDDSGSLQAEKRRRLLLPPNGHALGAWTAVNTSKLESTNALDNDLVLCINHDKFAVALRNRSLTALADEAICKSTSKVYAEVLRKLETSTRACKESYEVPDIGDGPELGDLPYVSTDDLVHVVKNVEELGEILGKVEGNSANAKELEHPKKRRKERELESGDEALVVGDASPDEDDDESDSENGDESSDSDQANGDAEYSLNSHPKVPEDTHRRLIRDHLLLLAKHPYPFLQHMPETAVLPERWAIYYQPLMKSIIHHVLIQIITTRYGHPAARLTRLLSERGKVDEKNLCSLSLLNQKSMRSYLTSLHKAGMIQLQEIPRDNSRNPQRTLYLWYFDAERCRVKILQETYKTMVRCLQRVRVEGDKVKGTLEKASRTDVIGREEEFLGVQEREALEKWRQVEERIWGELGRLDELVGILRDF